MKLLEFLGSIISEKAAELEKKREKILHYIEIHKDESEQELKNNYSYARNEEKTAIKEILKRKYGYSDEDF